MEVISDAQFFLLLFSWLALAAIAFFFIDWYHDRAFMRALNAPEGTGGCGPFIPVPDDELFLE